MLIIGTKIFDMKNEGDLKTKKTVLGQAKMTESRTVSRTENTDSTWTEQDVTVTYSYDSKGKMTGAVEKRQSMMGYPWGG